WGVKFSRLVYGFVMDVITSDHGDQTPHVIVPQFQAIFIKTLQPGIVLMVSACPRNSINDTFKILQGHFGASYRIIGLHDLMGSCRSDNFKLIFIISEPMDGVLPLYHVLQSRFLLFLGSPWGKFRIGPLDVVPIGGPQLLKQ